MNRFFVPALFLLTSLNVFGDNIKAHIIGENSTLISNAGCRIYSLPDSLEYSSCISDSTGFFSASYPSDRDWMLTIDAAGYKEFSLNGKEVLNIKNGKTRLLPGVSLNHNDMPLVFRIEKMSPSTDGTDSAATLPVKDLPVKILNENIATKMKEEGLDANESDSIPSQKLDEIVIEADRVSMTVNKVSHTPTKQQRNASANGVMLLQQLAIPQLTVNVLSGSVATNTGETVAFFIDGVPASDNDVADINTRDVMRVEVIDYPKDPKFRNASHVVNFIMQKYEYGGYTKLTSTEMLLSSFSSYNTLNSKMVYKNMTFDARAYYQYTNSSHSGADEIQLFRLPGYADVAPDGITRLSKVDNSKNIANRPSASFRALYQDSKTQFSSTVYWSYEGIRTNRRKGILSYSPSLFDADNWSIDFPSRGNTVNWDNDFYRVLPHNWSLSAEFGLAFNHINQNQIRSEGNNILRDFNAKEDIWGTTSSIEVSKQFNSIHSLSINAAAITYNSDIDYSGSINNSNHTSQLIAAPGLAYSFTPGINLSGHLGISATYYHAKAADVVESKLYPTVNFNINWMPHRRHRLGLFFNYSINTPEGSQTNAVLLQTDMLKWSQGNPELKSYHTLVAQISYTWNPSQFINFSPFVTWVRKNNYFADTYSLTDNGQGILVMPENCGNYNNIWGSLNISAYALGRKLVLFANPTISHHSFSGIYNKSHTTIFASINATYYFGQFYVGASYTTPKKYFNQADPMLISRKSQYWLMAGWGNSSWTVSAFLINPFRNHWRTNQSSLDTPLYSIQSTAISINEHRRLNLTIAYTIGYGKKINRGNDLDDISSSKSSIR